ncbi:branched-chain amino acid ABC transporter permease [Natronorubrum sulfidifaciens]|uniref:Inner-membrane translocator n=1 Tax=Natronorubrum sulfidifaciens JCM 14089 TaxID=1230460 RepID=L9W313_9EURY|nr:branched-chain amino acid ABC transporter permease [Natronorubrum sulfidifaciens]ELY43676.1 inner-membrane translocator [Natronorubrum sulfidifaciens JCM 14089]
MSSATDRLSTVTGRLDQSLQPLADGFNRLVGDYVGELNGLQFALVFGSLAAVLTAPFWGTFGLVRAMTVAAIWAIFAMSWDIQSGYTGYISFGHSVLSGAAAYTTAMLVHNVDPELSMAITIPVSILAALVVGLLIALPSLRLSGPYFSLITFVAVLIFYRLIPSFSAYTGGETGIQSVEVFTYDPIARYYYMIVPMLVIAVVLTVIARSNIGLILVSIRENEAAVNAAGIDATKFKIFSFALSSIPMGIGGVLLVHFTGGVDPTTFIVVDRSIEMIAMAVLGGMSSILGPLGGAFFLIVLRDYILTDLAGLSSPARWTIFWGLVLAVLVFVREGLFRKLWHTLERYGGGQP